MFLIVANEPAAAERCRNCNNEFLSRTEEPWRCRSEAMSLWHRRLRLQFLLRLSVRSCPRRSRRREPGRAMVVGPCREFFPACEGEPASFPSISARFTERLWLLLFSAAEPSPGLRP